MIFSRKINVASILWVLWAIWLAIIIVSGARVNWFPVEWNFNNTGAFGDSFGPLSAVMATVAALSAFATLREQREEISKQHIREIEQKTLAQNSHLEQTFFNLLSLFRDLVNSIDIRRDGKSDLVGQDAFQFFSQRIHAHTSTKTLEKAYQEVFNSYKNDLGHYFRTLYNIISFIDRWQNPEKYFYVKLIRAMLSESELLLIALNCSYGQGVEKFKPLIVKYTMLNNISPEAIVDYKLRDIFDILAFERG